MNILDLQAILSEPIINVLELSPGYEGHASDVWLIKTLEGEVVVRSSRMIEEPNNDFWWGCKKVFGIDPRRVWALEEINNTIKPFCSIPVPKVIQKNRLGNRECVIVEKLEGNTLSSFIDQSESILESLGEGLAAIHRYQSNFAGNPAGSFSIPIEKFHDHLSKSIDEIVSRFYRRTNIAKKLLNMFDKLKNLPSPDFPTFVLVDMDPTQFLSDGATLTGLVDTEAYVLAPREFEFIGLEYILGAKEAKAFRKGYEKLMPIPDLSLCRIPYRYFYRLISVQGKVEIDEWLNHEIYF